jgi:DNA primase
VGELSRLAPRIQLALDADGAGQEAMLRAARVAAGRRLELRVVPLPPGTDPADLVAAEGARAMQRLVDTSVPFVRFRVERELSTGDLGSAEGKDAVIGALRPVFAQIPPSALREELIALVADRTDLSPALVGSWLAQGAGRARGGGGGRRAGGSARDDQAAPGPAARPPRAVDAFVEAEQEFLVACVAAPKAGADALASLDLEAMFTDDVTRRAARHLRDHMHAPLDGLDAEDAELSTLIAKLSVRAAQALGSTDSIEGASINMELMRVRRDKAAARASGQGGVAQLAAREDELRRRLDRVIERAMATQGGDGAR